MPTESISPRTKLVAILGGGDWADASCDHLLIPEGMDLAEEKSAYQKWYRDVYSPSLRTDTPARQNIPFHTFVEWLKDRGAMDSTDEECLEFWDE